MAKKKVKQVCGNCLLYNGKNSTCKVAILMEGQQIHIPVEPNDACFFENKFQSNEGEFKDEVQQVRWWVEDEKGKPTDGDGTVKIEYPERFFGKTD